MKEELKGTLFSTKFLLSFGFMFLCFLGYSIPSWLCTAELEMEYRESALQLSVGSIFFGSVMMFMPFCAAVAHSTSLVDEMKTSVMCWRVLRGSVKWYAIKKAIASALGAAIATSLAFIIHAVLWNIIAVPVDPIHYQGHEIGFSETCLFAEWYKIWYGIPMYAEIACGIAFSAAVWAVVGLAIAVWIPDRLLVVSIPACIYYMWHLQLPYYLFGINIPHPGTLYNDSLSVESALQCIVAYVVVLMTSLLVYWKGLMRRACNA